MTSVSPPPSIESLIASILECGLPHGFKSWRSHAEVQAQAGQLGEEWQGQEAMQRQLASAPGEALDGFCAVCLQSTSFRFHVGEDLAVNWRESLRCRCCDLINRWRASAHLFRLLPRPPGMVYVTEQTTGLYQHLQAQSDQLVGSEFVDPGRVPGSVQDWYGQPLRHEDVTHLSFADESLAALLSFDVLEHVPDYARAIEEFARVLMPGGLLLLSAPFSLEARTTTVRARLDEHGEIEHLLPPQFHGDPLSDAGVLCYQEFGWDLLDALAAAGFCQVRVITMWAPAYGYLGTAQPFVVGWR